MLVQIEASHSHQATDNYTARQAKEAKKIQAVTRDQDTRQDRAYARHMGTNLPKVAHHRIDDQSQSHAYYDLRDENRKGQHIERNSTENIGDTRHHIRE